ncbi:adenylate kinase family protein [Candidatus Bathyarchaeota archaeon]|nr:adenylate kinase family protein [Candidatus Bathyarchaeota archaeon]
MYTGVWIELSRLILVTGTPGVGKTTVSRIIAEKLNGIHVDVGRVALEEGLTKGYSAENHSHIMDIERLSRRLGKIVKSSNCDVILDGHFIPKIYGFKPSLIYVLRCHPKILRLRLKRKGYPENKIADNVAAELLDTCLYDILSTFRLDKTVEIDTSKKKPAQVASLALKILDDRIKLREVKIDWLHRLLVEGKLEEILHYIESQAPRMKIR